MQDADREVKLEKGSYETMWLHDQEYLCSIPIVETPVRNETSEAEARAEEQKELARATDRGWELLQDLEGQDKCMYFVSGWWSYAFCYNRDVTQFHALPPQPGRPPFPPQRDPSTPQYTLGRVKAHHENNEDEWGNEIEVRKDEKSSMPRGAELQVKGDTRYLVQKMDHGTTCDLTGKPRRVEVQYHCNPQATDRIGYIKEITTCSYLMVVYTPRLCNDVAFLPPKESKANIIACRMVLTDDKVSYWKQLKAIEAELSMRDDEATSEVINIGGVIVGGGKYVSKDGQTLPTPANWASNPPGPVTDIIARSKSKADGGQVEVLSDEALQKLDLDPEVVERLKEQLQKMAGDKGWKIEVVDVPGDAREIRGIVDGDDEDDDGDGDGDDGDEKAENGEGESEAGSEETYKEEL